MDTQRTSTGFILLASIGGAVLLGTAAHAQWSKEQQSEFVRGCQASCQQNKKVSRPQLCPKFCECHLQEGQKRFPDYALLSKELAKKNADKVKSFMDVGPLCDKRVFGL